MLKELLANPSVQSALIDLAGTMIAIAFGVIPMLVIRWFKAHGMAFDEKQTSAVITISKAAGAYADEWARSVINGGGVRPSGAEKLSVAITAAKDLAAGAVTKALTKVTDDKWGLAIQAQLPELRAKLGASIPPLEALPVPNEG